MPGKYWRISEEIVAFLGGSFDAVGIVRAAGEKPALNALYDYAAYVGCSFGLSKVSVELDQKPLTPWSANMAAVQMRNSLDFVALRAKGSLSGPKVSQTSGPRFLE
jgi:hypothetical protein